MTSESPVCNFARCELFCPQIVMQGFGHLSAKTDATLNWNHLECEWPRVAPSPERMNKQQKRHSSRPAPNLNSTAPCEATVQSRSLLGWASEWREGNAALNEQSVVNHRVTPDRKQAVGKNRNKHTDCYCCLHRAERSNVLAPSRIFSFRNTSLLWYSAHMYVQKPTQTHHMQRHQSTYT